MATIIPRRVPSSFSLAIRPKPSSPSAQPLPHTSKRGAASFRRHRKLLNLPPAPHAGGAPRSSHPSTTTPSTTQAAASPAAIPNLLPRGGTSGRSRTPKSLVGQALLAAGDRIVYAPPSSTPNVFHTPLKFLPRDDPRRAHMERMQAMRASSTPSTRGTGGEVLPQPLSQPYEKSYHLSAESIEEMRRLRKSDENKWTRSALAEKFSCSRLFVGLVVQASAEKLKQIKVEKRARVESWGPIRRQARIDRGKRRELWARDE